MVILTSGPISLAQTAKNVSGWVLAQCSMVALPFSAQTLARSERKPLLNLSRGRPALIPSGLPLCPGFQGGLLSCAGCSRADW